MGGHTCKMIENYEVVRKEYKKSIDESNEKTDIGFGISTT